MFQEVRSVGEFHLCLVSVERLVTDRAGQTHQCN